MNDVVFFLLVVFILEVSFEIYFCFTENRRPRSESVMNVSIFRLGASLTGLLRFNPMTFPGNVAFR